MKPMITPPLPTHWSPEQALAVFEYVQRLNEQIWCYYQSDIMSLLEKARVQDSRQTPHDTFPPTLFGDNTDESDLPF